MNIKIKLCGKIKSYNVYNGLKKVFFLSNPYLIFHAHLLVAAKPAMTQCFPFNQRRRGLFFNCEPKKCEIVLPSSMFDDAFQNKSINIHGHIYNLREGNHSSEYMLLLLSAFYIYLAYKDAELIADCKGIF